MGPTSQTHAPVAVGVTCFAAVATCIVAVASRADPSWWPGPAAWAASLGLTLLAAWLLDHGHDHPAVGPPVGTREVVAVLVLLAIAVALRLFDLGNLPLQLHNDEMSCGLSARRFLDAVSPPLFHTGWARCPNLGYALTSLPMRLLGATVIGLRASSVALGMASLLGLTVLVRALFGPRAAVIALALTVSYPWHVHLSRTGFHYVQAATATVGTLALVAVALRSRRLVWFAAAGVCLGVGLQTYYAARLVPLLLMAWLVVTAWLRPGSRRLVLVGLGTTLVAAAITCAPLVPYFIRHPHELVDRTRSVLVFSSSNATHVAGVVGSSKLADILAYQLTRVAAVPFVGGDTSNQFHFIGPLVPRLLQVPFVVGLLLGVWSLLRSWRRRTDPAAEDPAPLGHALLWLWIGLTLVVGGVLTIDPPFTPRLSSLALAFMIPPAVAFDRVIAWPRRRRLRIAAGLVVASWTCAAVWAGGQAYFVDYAATSLRTRRDFLCRVLASHRGVRTLVTLLEVPEELGHEAYRFVAPDLISVQLDPEAFDDQYLDGLPGPVLVVVEDDDERLADLLRRHPEADSGRSRCRDGGCRFAWIVLP